MAESQTTGRTWATIIRDGSTPDGVKRLILAVNRETALRQVNRADVIIACAQILAQSIARDGPEVAAEMRAGIMSMIDGYAMEVAVND